MILFWVTPNWSKFLNVIQIGVVLDSKHLRVSMVGRCVLPPEMAISSQSACDMCAVYEWANDKIEQLYRREWVFLLIQSIHKYPRIHLKTWFKPTYSTTSGKSGVQLLSVPLQGTISYGGLIFWCIKPLYKLMSVICSQEKWVEHQTVPSTSSQGTSQVGAVNIPVGSSVASHQN